MGATAARLALAAASLAGADAESAKDALRGLTIGCIEWGGVANCPAGFRGGAVDLCRLPAWYPPLWLPPGRKLYGDSRASARNWAWPANRNDSSARRPFGERGWRRRSSGTESACGCQRGKATSHFRLTRIL